MLIQHSNKEIDWPLPSLTIVRNRLRIRDQWMFLEHFCCPMHAIVFFGVGPVRMYIIIV
jgi:hypothetical protein